MVTLNIASDDDKDEKNGWTYSEKEISIAKYHLLSFSVFEFCLAVVADLRVREKLYRGIKPHN